MIKAYRLTQQEWVQIEPVIPKVKRRKDGRGRPPKDPREVMEGILWVLFSGAAWHMLPAEFPSYQSCHRYFQNWTKQGVIKKILLRLSHYHGTRLAKEEMTYIDGSFAPAKKGVTKWAKLSGERVAR